MKQTRSLRTESVRFTVAMHIRHVAALDWNTSSKKFWVLPRSSDLPPSNEYDFITDSEIKKIGFINLKIIFWICQKIV